MEQRKDSWRTPLTVGSAALGFAIERLAFSDVCLIKRHDLILLAAVTAPSILLDVYRMVRQRWPLTAK
ncbi:hypothetical protein DC429_12645 [Arthrobacter sp. TPD3018]|uniref:hypothetical protein n=1 Tax=Bacteria TaxID=2 RepID=UPI000D51C99C|nr:MULTISPECIES: hypothetical protein [Bacteria]PVE53400.1 hypothetical protein DC425_13345 [Sphingomonas sp. TPD3009]PVE56162.1 hypothetical protein DC429_12645 [Arthrobacter sp. TPD3018]PVE81761.1 hypothetical protein DC431_14020 [Sphingomonas melonis]